MATTKREGRFRVKVRVEAYEAANFPEIEQCRGPVASNAIEEPRQTP